MILPPPPPPSARGRGVTAVLGPTNTGKTHLAIERMLGHESGLIGLPLRLLAREVYGRLVDRAGADNVALITGEEKIKPARPRYWVSTVEAMPRDLDVSFVALDEIQLAADLDRGHVFTNRLFELRGRGETMILGAATMRGLIEKLLPGVSIVSRARMSQLVFAGERKMTRLPRRSAIVAFSADEVYAIAELIRRQRGGAAVVLGALSPRTRNAQVALYQSGEVDYLVATDAIGMGLNLDVDHVAFASDRKFDGFQFRRLNPAEFAQVAGRAGRHVRDGTFGTTGRCPPLEPELVQRLESHNFDPVRVLQWRNPELDFRSIERLRDSLAVSPREQGLTRAPGGDDIDVLEHAARDSDVRRLAVGAAEVKRLWEVCQIPDFRKIAPAQHADLVTTLYGFVAGTGKIPTDWFARQVAATDRTDGDIDTLSNRIAHIRTWTFVANRPDWLDDPEHWQEVARGVEDKLSDALHERLTQRFVDRRTSVLMRRLREKDMLEAEITPDGEVRVEGHPLGRLSGFTFTAETSASAEEGRALRAAAAQVLAGEIEARAKKFSTAADSEIVLSADGAVRWLGDVIGRLITGEKALSPRIRLIADEQLSGPAKELAERRLELWLKAHIEKLLGPLIALETAADLQGMARGIAYQLVESLGVLDRGRVANDVRALDQDARASLRKHGVRFGAYHIYLPALLKPAPRALAAQLWMLHHGTPDQKGLAEIGHLAASGRTSIPVDKDVPKGLYRALGYKVAGERAVRIDILERLADLIRPAIAFKVGLTQGEAPAGAAEGDGFVVTTAMTSLVGCSGEDFASVLRGLGYRMELRPAPPPQPAAPPVAETAEAAAPAAGDTSAAVPSEAGAEADDALPVEAGAAEEVALTDTAESPSPALASGPEDLPEALHSESGAAVDAIEAEASDAPEVVDAPPAQAELDEAATEPVAPAEAEPVASAEAEAASSEPAEAVAEPGPEAATPTADGTAAAESAAESAAPAEPAMRQVWRPGRFEGRSREQQPNRGRGKPQQGGRGDRPRHGGDRPRPEAGAEAAPAMRRAEGGEHRARAPEGQERRGPRPPRPEQNRGPGAAAQGGGPRPQRKPERAPDPDSPFAALLKLKESLEAKGKDRR